MFNNNFAKQPFTYLVQITDSSDIVSSLSWITGNFETTQYFSSSVSWIPTDPGKYTATIFVWTILTNPIALSPPIELTFDVI